MYCWPTWHMMMNKMKDAVIWWVYTKTRWCHIMALTRNLPTIVIISLIINLSLNLSYISLKTHNTHAWNVQSCPFHNRIRYLKLFKSMIHLLLLSSEFHNFTPWNLKLFRIYFTVYISEGLVTKRFLYYSSIL